MIWGAYNIFKTPDGFIATYKVANRWTWHTSTIWSDSDALEEEIKRILDDWVKRNSSEPVSEDENRGMEEMGIETLGDSTTYTSLVNEYNTLYSQVQQECATIAQNIFPLSWEGSLLWNWETQVNYIDTCLLESEQSKKIKIVFQNIIKLYLETKYSQYKTLKWFSIGYAQAISDTWNFIASLDKEEFAKIKQNIIDSWENGVEYIANIWAYWSASIDYWITNDNNALVAKNDLATKISFGSEILEIEQLISEIDWENIEDADYWSWYIGGYLAENMVVWYSIGKAINWVSKHSRSWIKTIINKVINASKIWKLDYNTKVLDIYNYPDITMADLQKFNQKYIYNRIKKWTLKLKTPNWIEYRIANSQKFNQHIKWTIEYDKYISQTWEYKSYFKETMSTNEVYDLTIEVIEKISKNKWDDAILKKETIKIDVGRIIGKNVNTKTWIIKWDTSTVTVHIKDDSIIHIHPSWWN